MSARRLSSCAAALVLALAVGACGDDEPGSEGWITVTVEAAVPLGAAVIDLRGGTILAVEPLASGWAVLEALPTQGTQAAHRLLVVQRQTGTLSARIRVPDVEGQLPTATVIEASGADDRPLAALGGLQVRVVR